MIYSQEITLDLNTSTSYFVVGAKQGDSNSRLVKVNITENGKTYIIPNKSTAYFRLKKPDGKAILNEANIDYTTNSITFFLSNQALAVPGRGYADIILYGSSQEILSTVSFILLIMAAPDIINEATSSNEFSYLQSIVDNANRIIFESEAWASGTRSSLPLAKDIFEYEVSTETLICQIDKDIFREQVGIFPGATNTYKFTYDGEGWIYTNADGVDSISYVDLNDFGITVSGMYYATNNIIVTVTDADLQYQNNAKYWVDSIKDTKESIDNLDISTTILDEDDEPFVEKSSINDITINYNSANIDNVNIDKDIFLSKADQLGDYIFTYTDGNWYYYNESIDLIEYGITYSGTAADEDTITVHYNQHTHFNFNIPRGLTGNTNFMTFDIDTTTGMLNMYKPAELTQVDFEIIQTGDNIGCLGIRINMGDDY